MSPSPTDVVILAFEALNRADDATLHRLVADDATFAFPRFAPDQVFTGHAGVDRFSAWLRERFPSLTMAINKLSAAPAADGAWVVTAEWTDAGRTPDGRPFENLGVTVFELRDGRIARMRTYLDTAQLADTLGTPA
jgi:ketosteroid isomerase-like protein